MITVRIAAPPGESTRQPDECYQPKAAPARTRARSRTLGIEPSVAVVAKDAGTPDSGETLRVVAGHARRREIAFSRGSEPIFEPSAKNGSETPRLAYPARYMSAKIPSKMTTVKPAMAMKRSRPAPLLLCF